jgi:type IV fimbrial biogenesis protein FimT
MSRPRRAGAAGFTLIELLVTLTILAILLGIAIPSYRTTISNTRAGEYANELMASALLARGEAIKRNAVVSLCVSSNGTACGSGGWEQGWLVSCPTTDGTNCDAAGTGILIIATQAAAKSGWKITEAAGLSLVTFDPSGTGATAASFTVCMATPTVGQQQRTVRITATGRPAVSKLTSTVCS